MRLELTTNEARELALALQLQTRELRVELANTDARDYRSALRQRLSVLEPLSARLAASLPTPSGGAVIDSRRAERLANPDAAEEEAERMLADAPSPAEAIATNPDAAEEEAERMLASAPVREDGPHGHRRRR